MLVILPLPLLFWAVRSGHYRHCLAPFIAVAGIYVFTCLGAPHVVSQAALYSDRYFYTMVVVILCCYALYGILVGLGPAVETDYSDLAPEPLGRTLLLFGVLWTYSVGIMVLYMSRHGAPPLLTVLGGGHFVDVYAVRAEKTTSIAEGTQWYILGLQTIPYFTFIYSYVLKTLRPGWATRALFLMSLVVALTLATSFANKDVLLHLAMFVLLTRICIVPARLRLRTALLFGALGLGSVYLFLRLYLLDRDSLAVLRLFGGYLADRILYVYAEAHAYVVQIFPQQHAYFDGSALANPGGIFPFTPIELSRYLGYRVLGHVANYSTPAFTHGYANFGIPGLFLIMGVMGVQLLFVQAVFRRLPRTPLFASIYVLMAERMLKYGSEPIQSVIAEEVVLFLGVTVILHYVTRDLAWAVREAGQARVPEVAGG